MDVLQTLGVVSPRNLGKSEAPANDTQSWDEVFGEVLVDVFEQSAGQLGGEDSAAEFVAPPPETDVGEGIEVLGQENLTEEVVLQDDRGPGVMSEHGLRIDDRVAGPEFTQQDPLSKMSPTEESEPQTLRSGNVENEVALDQIAPIVQRGKPGLDVAKVISNSAAKHTMLTGHTTEVSPTSSDHQIPVVRTKLGQVDEPPKRIKSEAGELAASTTPPQGIRTAVFVDSISGDAGSIGLKNAPAAEPIEAIVQGGKNLSAVGYPNSREDPSSFVTAVKVSVPDQNVNIEKSLSGLSIASVDVGDLKPEADVKLLGQAQIAQAHHTNSPIAPNSIGPQISAVQREQAVVMQISHVIEAGEKGRIELRLDPAELGKVRIQMVLRDGIMTATIQAERPETLDLLRRNSDSLDLSFAEQGYSEAKLDFQEFEQDGNENAQPSDDVIWAGPEEVPLQPTINVVAQQASGLDIKL